MKSKLVMHTKMTGEIFLSIFSNNKKIGEIALGTAPKEARAKAQEFKEAVSQSEDIIDQIT